jgi:hypothetical protein
MQAGRLTAGRCAGAMFVQLLEQFRREAVKEVFMGPRMQIDMVPRERRAGGPPPPLPAGTAAPAAAAVPQEAA